jgi:hypothetical protein
MLEGGFWFAFVNVEGAEIVLDVGVGFDISLRPFKIVTSFGATIFVLVASADSV